MNDIVVGDVVYMKTFGPAMTVEVIKGEQATCVWFERFGSADYGMQSAYLNGAVQKWQGPFRESFVMAVLKKTEATK